MTDAHSLAEHDLACYAVAMWPQFELAAHIRLLVEKLEAVERGDVKRLMIFLPPRHGKSLTASQLAPAWWLGRHPDQSVITATYGQDLFGRRVRNFVTDQRHQEIFPACRVSTDSSAAQRFDLKAGGSYYAVGRGGPLTGRGASLLVLDDLLKDREEAYSETVRRNLHDWFSSVAYTRLAPGGAIVYVATRWHEDDLAGRLLREQAGEWDVLSLPAICEQDDGFRLVGEALWPEKYPLPVLEQIRTAIGGAAWTSLYQQRPSAAEGAVFRRDWWRFYKEPPQFKRIVQSWDTAFKTGETNDYSVCTTWGVTETGYYLLHVWRERVEFPALKRRLCQWADEWKPSAVLVEDRASGQSLIQELKLASRLPVLAIKADSDKVSRAQAVTPMIEAGRVFLPESAPWLNDYLDELSGFPAALHDDSVDSTTQALNFLRERTGGRLTFHRVLIGLPYSPFDF